MGTGNETLFASAEDAYGRDQGLKQPLFFCSNCGYFGAHFRIRKRFCPLLRKIQESHLAYPQVFGENFIKMATFCPLCPLSYPKAATEKPSIYAGLRGLWPLCPPFSLFNCDKKFKKYKEVCKKPGQSGHLRIRKIFFTSFSRQFYLSCL